MPKLSLSYDAPEVFYKVIPNFRRKLLKFLLQNEAEDPACHAASTIYFDTDKRRPLTTWKMLLQEEFGDKFHFTISRVHQWDSDDYAIMHHSKKSFVMNFKEDLRAARRGLRKR